MILTLNTAPHCTLCRTCRLIHAVLHYLDRLGRHGYQLVSIYDLVLILDNIMTTLYTYLPTYLLTYLSTSMQAEDCLTGANDMGRHPQQTSYRKR